VPGSHLVIEDVLANPGRLAYLDVLCAMGAAITVTAKPDRGGEPVGRSHRRARSPLRGTTIRSQEAIVDELPVLRGRGRVRRAASPRSATRPSCG
jgi:5-enolpyruvylshikimate-3-phosphate synthase